MMTSEEQKGGGFPETCKMVMQTGYGGYDKVKCEQKPFPKPEAGQLVVQIKAAGVNFSDLHTREGMAESITLPACMGKEASGDVVVVGEGVDNFKPGDRISCVNKIGLWAEYAAVPAVQCFKIPDDMTYEDAAAIPINYITAYHILFDFGNLRPGKSVLIHMAAGGVGTAATQLCRTVEDVKIFGTASLSKHETIQSNGVDYPIDYRSKDYVEEIKKIDPEGVDIVMDPLNGPDAVKGFNLLKPLGRVIHFGWASAMTGTSKSYWSMLKSYLGMKSYNSLDLVTTNKAVCGYHMGYLNDPKVIQLAVVKLLDLYKDHKIKPRIDSVWALEDVGLAMARLHDRVNIGKVLISPQKDPQEKPK